LKTQYDEDAQLLTLPKETNHPKIITQEPSSTQHNPTTPTTPDSIIPTSKDTPTPSSTTPVEPSQTSQETSKPSSKETSIPTSKHTPISSSQTPLEIQSKKKKTRRLKRHKYHKTTTTFDITTPHTTPSTTTTKFPTPLDIPPLKQQTSPKSPKNTSSVTTIIPSPDQDIQQSDTENNHPIATDNPSEEPELSEEAKELISYHKFIKLSKEEELKSYEKFLTVMLDTTQALTPKLKTTKGTLRKGTPDTFAEKLGIDPSKGHDKKFWQVLLSYISVGRTPDCFGIETASRIVENVWDMEIAFTNVLKHSCEKCDKFSGRGIENRYTTFQTSDSSSTIRYI